MTPDLADDATRRDLGRVIGSLFQKWQLPIESQLALLGMDPQSREELAQISRGERSLPNVADTLDRAGYLLRIHKGLRVLFPENSELRYPWVRRRNRLFDTHTPLQIMVDDGAAGLARVAGFIDHQLGQ